MDNKPLLFVNSISKNETGVENQLFYDSRRYIKGLVMHRIDDILGFLNFGKKVYIVLEIFDKIFYGEVYKIDNRYLSLINNDNISVFVINNIKNIKIDRIL